MNGDYSPRLDRRWVGGLSAHSLIKHLLNFEVEGPLLQVLKVLSILETGS